MSDVEASGGSVAGQNDFIFCHVFASVREVGLVGKLGWISVCFLNFRAKLVIFP